MDLSEHRRDLITAVVTGRPESPKLSAASEPGYRRPVLVAAGETGLSRDSVVNVSQVVTLDKSFLAERVGLVGGRAMLAVEDGLRTVLAL